MISRSPPGKVTAVGDTILFSTQDAADLCLRPAGAHRNEAGIALDLHAPALIVTEVKVEHIHLQQRQGVDELLHRRNVGKMTGHIEHETPPLKTRAIFYFLEGDRRCFIPAIALF